MLLSGHLEGAFLFNGYDRVPSGSMKPQIDTKLDHIFEYVSLLLFKMAI